MSYRPAKLSHLLVFVALAPLGLFWPAVAQEAAEYQLKAAILFHFAKFTEWPHEAFADPSAPLTLGVLGEDPFGRAFDVIKGQSVQNRKLEVRRFSEIDEIDACQILFISDSERSRLAEIFQALKDSTVLTVGDVQNFIHLGGVIRFYVLDEKVKFQVNSQALRKAKYKISTQLLKFAEFVTPKKTGEGK